MKIPRIWFAAIPAVLGFCLYLNTIQHGYVYDDIGVITSNPNVMEGMRGIPKILSVDMWHFQNMNLGYYRPLSLITFAIENEYFPKNPHVSHLVNVLLYGMTGFFLFLLLGSLLVPAGPVFPLLATVLFIAHPVHTEVVANIKSRDEILAFLNLLIALLLFLKAYRGPTLNRLHLSLSCVFFYLALLSKETAMTGIVVAPLLLFYSSPRTARKCLSTAVPFLLVIAIFHVQKYLMLGTLSGEIPQDIVNYPYTESGAGLPSTLIVFLHCLQMIIFPQPLSYDYSYNQIPAGTFDSPGAYVAISVVVALGYFSFKGLSRKSPLALGVLILCVTLAPALAFVFWRGGIFAERFLYVPSLGFSIIIAVLLAKLTKFPLQAETNSITQFMKLAFPFLVVVSLYTFKTVTRNPIWHDNLTLFSTDVIASPNSCQVRRHLGTELVNMAIVEKYLPKRKELFEKGTFQLREALRINPHYGEVYCNLGVAHQSVIGDFNSAISYYKRAIQEAPYYAFSYNNLGTIYETIGLQTLASFFYFKATEVNPYFPDAVKNRVSHMKKTGLDVREMPISNN